MDRPLKIVHISSVDLGISFLLPQLHALREDGFEVHAMCPDGPLVPSFEAEGIEVHRIRVTRDITPFQDLKLLAQLVRIFRRERYALVHTHTPKIEFVGQLAARIARVPAVLYTNHGLIFLGRTGLQRFMFKAIARLGGLCSDRVLSQSAEDISTMLSEKLYRREQVEFLGNGIDVSKFSARNFTPAQVEAKKIELNIPPDHKVVGMVGRYVWEKGYREFFEAAQIVLRENPNVTFVTIGSALESERDPVDFSILKEMGIEDRTRVLRSRDDMPALYALMDAVVLPSYREGFPRTLMEAAAMSKPIVASNVSGCRQVVVDGKNGYLVPVTDSRTIADKIMLLLNNPSLAAALGANGRVMAEAQFDVADVVARLRACYATVLKDKLPGLTQEPITAPFASEARASQGR